ncbi:hypothetical protein [Salmonella enterica]|uniref:hypothetical protein n=1 Tax=Salmonella enterica TaxID=28901 RepID=UPI00398C2D5B
MNDKRTAGGRQEIEEEAERMAHCSCHDKPTHGLLPAAYCILSITRHTPRASSFRLAVSAPAHSGQSSAASPPRLSPTRIPLPGHAIGPGDLLTPDRGNRHRTPSTRNQ